MKQEFITLESVSIYAILENAPLLEIPFAASTISAGFPSPANDYIETRIDLNQELIKNPSSTFFARVSGFSMKNIGIEENDILIIDKSLTLKNNSVAVCCLDGEFTLKRISIKKDAIWLIPENDDFKPIIVTKDNDFIIWGIVTFVIKSV